MKRTNFHLTAAFLRCLDSGDGDIDMCEPRLWDDLYQWRKDATRRGIPDIFA